MGGATVVVAEKGEFRRRLYWSIAAAICIAGIAIRLYSNAHKSVWIDELYTLMCAFEPSIQAMFENMLWQDVHPPLYSVAVWLWTRAFGIDHDSVRMLSLTAWAVNFALLARLGLRWIGPLGGLIACALFAFLKQPVFFSIDARAGALAMLIGTWFLAVWLEAYMECLDGNTPGWGRTVHLGVAGGALCLTTYVGLPLAGLGFGALFVACAVRARGGLLQAVTGGLVSAAVFSFWVPTLLHHLRDRPWHAQRPTWLSGTVDVAKFLLSPYSAGLLLLAIAAVLLLRERLAGSLEEPRREWHAAGWLALLPALLFLFVVGRAVYSETPQFLPRMLVVIVPVAYLVIAFAVSRFVLGLGKWLNPAIAIGTVAALGAGLASERVRPMLFLDEPLSDVSIGYEQSASALDEATGGSAVPLVAYYNRIDWDESGSWQDRRNSGWTPDRHIASANYVLEHVDAGTDVDRFLATGGDFAGFCNELNALGKTGYLWAAHGSLPEDWQELLNGCVATRLSEVNDLYEVHLIMPAQD